TLTIPANPQTVGGYRAVFSNACGTNTSSSATLVLGTSLSCNIDGPGVVCPNSIASLFDAPGFATYQWSISGNGSIVGSANSHSVVVNAHSAGMLTLALQVTDSTGCIGNCTRLVTIQDTEPPAISCPANVTVNASPGSCVSNVTFVVTATDNCTIT